MSSSSSQVWRKYVQLHDRPELVPYFRQLIYGKDKMKRVAHKNLATLSREQKLLQTIKGLGDDETGVRRGQEYLKFTSDIRRYDFTKPVPSHVMRELDMEDIERVCREGYGQYLPYDSEFTDDMYNVYLVRRGATHYVCVYDFGRYFDQINPLQHPKTRLITCLALKLS